MRDNLLKESEYSGEIGYSIVESPLGDLLVAGGRLGISALSFIDGSAPLIPGVHWTRSHASLRSAEEELEAYFRGDLTVFSLQLDLRGTSFQRSVWNELRNIPYGQTASYAEIAAAVGRPTATRAVGAAIGANPIAIVVPCHRVIGSDGRLTGYRGGLEIKRRLLELEASAMRKKRTLGRVMQQGDSRSPVRNYP